MELMPHKDKEALRTYNREYGRKYRAINRARVANNNRKYAASHRDAIFAKNKRYRDENREWIAEKKRQRHFANPNIKREYNREWYSRHPEIKERMRERHRLNPEKGRARGREYYKKNPHVAVKHAAIRRMRIEATVESESAIADFIKMVRNSRRVACYYCKTMVGGKKAHIDHIVALSRGGHHRPDNLCASCPPCNFAKHAKLIGEWTPPTAQQILPL